jgi:hypothetical protein
MQQIASHHKRERMADLLNSNDETQAVDGYVQIKKVANLNKSRINDFQCQAYFHDQIFDFQLSQVFQTTRFAVLFFCSYDLYSIIVYSSSIILFCNGTNLYTSLFHSTQQSKDDLRHIESVSIFIYFSDKTFTHFLFNRENYSKFVQYGALPIAITHDRAQIHLAYATPGKTVASLNFKPSFLLGMCILANSVASSKIN